MEHASTRVEVEYKAKHAFAVGSYLMDLRGRTLLHYRLAVVSWLTAVFTPATEVSLILTAPALRTV